MITKAPAIISVGILGVLMALQLKSTRLLNDALDPSNQQTLAQEVSQIFTTNKKLEAELSQASEQTKKLEESSASAVNQRSALSAQLAELKVLAGEEPVHGEGIVLTFANGLTVSQFTDLANALRNVGIEAVELNGKRLLWRDGVAQDMVGHATTIKAIGKKAIVKDALERRGGVLEQIGLSSSIEAKDDLSIAKR